MSRAAPLAALLVLAACDAPESETVTAVAADPQAEALKNAPAAAPLPMIKANRTWRCKDNSLVYAEFYTDDTVQIRAEKDGPATKLSAAGGQPPYTAEGWSLSANAEQVTLTAPGKSAQSCRARAG